MKAGQSLRVKKFKVLIPLKKLVLLIFLKQDNTETKLI